jgi:hypothetical protein
MHFLSLSLSLSNLTFYFNKLTEPLVYYIIIMVVVNEKKIKTRVHYTAIRGAEKDEKKNNNKTLLPSS